MAVPQARADQVITFATPSGNVGSSSHLYSATGGDSVLAQAYTCSYTSSGTNVNIASCGTWSSSNIDLYGNSGGLGVTGLTDTSNALQFTQSLSSGTYTDKFYFVQLDFSQALPSATIQLGSLSSGATWYIYESSTAGTLGTNTYIASGSGSNLTATISNITPSEYFTLVVDCYPSTTDTGLLNEITIPGGATPEPGTCLLMGVALVGLGVGGKKLRRRS
jgi:hypothetical protein